MLGAEYEGLDGDDKAPYEQKAADDLERFENEQAAYTTYMTKGHGLGPTATSGEVMQALPAELLFMVASRTKACSRHQSPGRSSASKLRAFTRMATTCRIFHTVFDSEQAPMAKLRRVPA